MEPTSPETMTERHARILGRLAEVGMALVEDLAAATLAAEDAHEKAALAGACHKFTRSVRQSLALEARFARDAERARHEAEHRAQTEAASAPARRRAEAKARLDRLIWTEAESDPVAAFWEEGAARLLADAEFTAPDQPVEALVETIAATLREAEPRTGKPGKPETVIFEWKIVDPKEENPPPQGEGDRPQDRRTADPSGNIPVEGVEAHAPCPSTPSVSCADSSPGGEHLGAQDPPPQGEVAAKPSEGVEAHAARQTPTPPDAGGFNPLSPCGTAPPEGEHLGFAPPRRRWPYGLPGEFGPNGETGEDRVIGVI